MIPHPTLDPNELTPQPGDIYCDFWTTGHVRQRLIISRVDDDVTVICNVRIVDKIDAGGDEWLHSILRDPAYIYSYETMISWKHWWSEARCTDLLLIRDGIIIKF